ncbi:MAG TPA: translocation/assembly module TamB domain-containing protein, partial [Pedomonas sp.]|nr:translocation/assembly module TamB domain-containing protein [Pedomonas sp.]
FPMNVKISLENFQAARTDAIQAVISGPVTITRNPNGGLIAGELGIIEARYRFTGMAAAEVPQLAVQRVGEAPAELVAEARRADPTLDFDLDVKVRADNRIFIEGMGLDSEWGTNLTIGGTVSHPQLTGTVEVVRGNYAFAGRRFDFNRGIIRLGGEFPPNPTLDIEAGATVEGIEALLLVTGPALKPEINFSSSPVLPQDEILSRLLFGGSAAELSATEALQLGAALASLRGGGGGLNPLGKIRQATSVDRLRIVGADETTGRGTSLAVGQYLTDDVYVEVSSDTQGNTLTQLQIELTRALSILSQVGQTGSSSLQLQYAKDY